MQTPKLVETQEQALPRKLSKRVHRAIQTGLADWAARRVPTDGGDTDSNRVQPRAGEQILASIPRRVFTARTTQQVSLPSPRVMTFKTRRLQAFGRLFIWLNMLAYFIFGTFWDRLRRRNTEARRAVRLRKAF